jgi:Xaa-Pro dipeptidase
MRRRDALALIGFGLGAAACGATRATTRRWARARTTPATDFAMRSDYAALPPLGDDVYQRRRARMRELAGDTHADVVLATSGATNFAYLVGADFGRSERLIALLLPASGDPVVIAPSFEVERVRRGARGLPVRGWEEQADPIALTAGFLGASPRVLVEPRTDYAVAAALARALPGARLVDGFAAFEELRVHKSDEELVRMRRAVAITEDAWAATFDALDVGMSEADVSRLASRELERRGLDGGALVQFGPNSALPHGGPSKLRLAENTVVLIDGGATVQGWWSDVTRTRWFGGAPSEKFVRIYNLVHDAQSAAIARVRPGVPAQEIDRAARSVIDQAGFGAQFTHRLGHGMGMSMHEAAYMVEGNPRPLEPGFVFSVEPGVYLPGEFGVRLEDDVACGASGADVLSRRAPRI